MKYLLYAISLFLPFAGIAVKIISNRTGDEHKRRIGDICLLLSAVPTAILMIVLGFHALMLQSAPPSSSGF